MRSFFFFLLGLRAFQLSAQDFSTITYFEQDSLKLNLELFLPSTSSEKPSPLVLFVHGGGFKGGKTTDGHNLARHLVKHNIALASIEYTLYMKDKSFSCDGITSEKVKAIQIAASQAWHATAYLIESADQFNIDPSKIFLAGNSAGAETAYHAAYWDRSYMQLYNQVLDTSFNYSGIIGGAGAIMDLNLITAENALPTLAFHGDEDPAVPYATAAHHYCQPNATGWLMLFGSKSIVEHLQSLEASSILFTFQGGNHDYHNYYFEHEQQEVSRFIQMVLAQQSFSSRHIIKNEDD